MTHEINFRELAKLSPEQRAKLQQRTETDLSDFEAKVRPIIAAVRAEGDEALSRFARDFDKAPVRASEIAATESDFAAAEKALDPKVREAMEFAAHSIRKFHEHQMPEDAEGLPLGVQLASDLGHDLQLLGLGEVLHRQPDNVTSPIAVTVRGHTP